MRSVSAVVGGVIILAAIVTAFTLVYFAVNSLAWSAREAVVRAALEHMVPRMNLTLDECVNGYSSARLTVLNPPDEPKILYVVEPQGVHAFSFNGASVEFTVPCDRPFTLVIETRNSITWTYRLENDPKYYCLSGSRLYAHILLSSPCSSNGTTGGYGVRVLRTIAGYWYALNTGGKPYILYYLSSSGEKIILNNGPLLNVSGACIRADVYVWDLNPNYIIFRAPVNGTLYLEPIADTGSANYTEGFDTNMLLTPPDYRCLDITINISSLDDIYAPATRQYHCYLFNYTYRNGKLYVDIPWIVVETYQQRYFSPEWVRYQRAYIYVTMNTDKIRAYGLVTVFAGILKRYPLLYDYRLVAGTAGNTSYTSNYTSPTPFTDTGIFRTLLQETEKRLCASHGPGEYLAGVCGQFTKYYYDGTLFAVYNPPPIYPPYLMKSVGTTIPSSGGNTTIAIVFDVNTSPWYIDSADLDDILGGAGPSYNILFILFGPTIAQPGTYLLEPSTVNPKTYKIGGTTLVVIDNVDSLPAEDTPATTTDIEECITPSQQDFLPPPDTIPPPIPAPSPLP